MNLDTGLLDAAQAVSAARGRGDIGPPSGGDAGSGSLGELAHNIGYALGLDAALIVRCAEQIADLYQEVTDLREQVARLHD